MIREDLLVYALCTIAGYFALRWRFGSTSDRSQASIVNDVLPTAIFIVLVTWKLSVALFHPVMTWQHPSSLLYLTGGLRGMLLGLVIALVYLGVHLRRGRIHFWIFAESVLFGYIAGSSVYYLALLFLHDASVIRYGSAFVVHIGLLLWMKAKHSTNRKAVDFHQYLLWFCLIQLVLSIFMDNNHFFWRFSIAQIVYSVTSLYTLVFLNMIERRIR